MGQAAPAVLLTAPPAADRRGFRTAVLGLAAILVIATALRVLLIPARELWLDETHSIHIARLGLTDLLRFIRGDVHPPFYFLFLSAWIRLVGDDPAALRLLSAVFSVATVAVLYVAALRFTGRRIAALGAAALAATAPILLHYGVEVRMYALGVLLISVALVFLPGAVEARPRHLAGFTLASILALYSHYMAIFAVAGLLAWFALEELRRRRRPKRALGAAILIALAFSPWLPVLATQRQSKADLRRAELAGMANPEALNYRSTANLPPPVPERIRSGLENVASAAGAMRTPSAPLTVLVNLPVALAGLAVLILALRGGRTARLALLVGLATAAGCLVVGATARRFMILAVPVWIVALAELVTVPQRRAIRLIGGGIIAGMIALQGAGSIGQLGRPRAAPVQAAVGFLAERYRPGDLVVFNAAYFEIPFDYYATRRSFRPVTRGFPLDIEVWWRTQPFKGWGGPVPTRPELARFVAGLRQELGGGQGTAWLVLYETAFYDPSGLLRKALEAAGTAVDAEFSAGAMRIMGFRLDPLVGPPGGARSRQEGRRSVAGGGM